MEKRALQLASVASMIDLFNAENISILLSLGYSVDVATNFEVGSTTSKERVIEYRNELIERGIGAYHVPIPRSLKKIGSIVKSYKEIKRLVMDNKYQIVHCHSPIGGVVCRLACRKARKLYGTKVFYTAHGFHFFKGASMKAWLLFYPVEKLCSRYTDVLITINQEDYRIAKKMSAKQVEYIPGIGIKTESIRDVVVDKKSIRSEFGFSDDDFVFMSTGQLSIRKNHEMVLKALSLIDDVHIKYLIVGSGEEELRLRKMVDQLKLAHRVVFAGYRNDAIEILHAVDAFAFPSLQEGLPVALMEAMAVGLPIVATQIRGNVDLITDGQGGWLVDRHDYLGFAEGMKKAYENKQVGLINLEVIKGFDYKIVNEDMKRIYQL